MSKPLNWRIITDVVKRAPIALRIADRLGRGRGRMRVLDGWNPPRPPKLVPDLTGWEDHDLAACWLGHATVLLRIGGQTILTDPVLSHRVGITLGVMTGGPRRISAAALPLDKLPALDLILLSHAHFDHLDRPTLHRLPRSTPVITAHRTTDLVRDLGYKRITELRWGEHLDLAPLRVTARQVNHWGARTFYDTHRGYNAYLIESASRRVLYGGDTAYFDGFADIGGVELAILGIGAYNPWIAAHANPEQAWDMANQMRAEHIMGIHHSTFRLSYEPDDEPLERLMTVAGRDAERVVASEVGGMWVDRN